MSATAQAVVERVWPADEVKRRKVADLIPYARNARMHSDAQISQIAASIREWGWTNPVLVDEDDNIIAGHGRVLAAHKLSIVDIPTMEAKGWTEAQKRAYILADNQLAANAGWDMDLLKVELQELDGFEFDIDLIGFDGDFLANILHDEPEGLTDPDFVPEVPEQPVTQPGDVWVLGNHRIICGDATDAATVETLLGNVKPHLMVTDPPYGVAYDPKWREGRDLGIGKRSKGTVDNDDTVDWTQAWVLFPGNVAYVWHAALRSTVSGQNLIDCGFNIRAQIIWVKQHFAMSRGDYHWQHEPCWYAVKKNVKGQWKGDRKQSTVWEIANNNAFGGTGENKSGHGTQKPVECMRRPMENNSSPGQAVYDPFVGSGTTIIAGEISGRHVYAIEINPAYVDVCVRRWEDFTGGQAHLEATGELFRDRE